MTHSESLSGKSAEIIDHSIKERLNTVELKIKNIEQTVNLLNPNGKKIKSTIKKITEMVESLRKDWDKLKKKDKIRMGAVKITHKLYNSSLKDYNEHNAKNNVEFRKHKEQLDKFNEQIESIVKILSDVKQSVKVILKGYE